MGEVAAIETTGGRRRPHNRRRAAWPCNSGRARTCETSTRARSTSPSRSFLSEIVMIGLMLLGEIFSARGPEGRSQAGASGGEHSWSHLGRGAGGADP
jgi:hypothetical protein